jgi:DNA-binding MarR family transcriptional regulator
MVSPEIEGPAECYCLASRRSARFLTRLYEQHLRPSGLTSSQFSILSYLDHRRSMTIVELSEVMEMERTTLVRTLRPLKDAGLIGEGSRKLGRASTLQNTSLGAAKLQEATPMWESAQRAFEAQMTPDAAADLREIARTMIQRRPS